MASLNRHPHTQYSPNDNDKPVIWGLVLSRKNSKRLPGKTLRSLAGKPMLAYTLEAAKGAYGLDQCWMFSDDSEALQLADSLGIRIPSFERPEQVSHDKATSEETVHYFLSQFPPEKLPDYLMLLQATSPLRTSQDIDGAIETLFGHSTVKADGLVSIFQPAKPLSWLYEQDPGTLLLTSFTQESEHWKMPNGAIYIIKPKDVLAGKGLLAGNILGYEMPWQRSIDVDTIEDFLFAEALLANSVNPSQASPQHSH